ncbi:DUF4333 domain-containing protein [Nocardioides taihuensis]|uniref:DUF4333 domain-containing protein n=1 Tax=Nocardioides taihuensis TaxID=1835606 RepID=A0ABW0BJY7_9ACTN
MRSRAPLIAVVLTVLLAALVVLVWGRSMFSSVAAVSQSELEQEVAGRYTPGASGEGVTASCDGDLESEVDATQDCAVQVGADVARVHVVVDRVDGTDVRFTSTPYLSAADVAEAIRKSLGSGFQVDTIECAGELQGVEGSRTTCTYTPPASGREVEAEVTEVDGLMINFDFQETS